MAETSRLWNGSSIGDAIDAPYDEDELADVLMSFTRAARLTNKGGTFSSVDNGLAVTSPVSNTARLATGIAQVYGAWYRNSSTSDLTIPTPASSTRIDRVVLRKDWTAQTVRFTRIAGVEGGSEPALVQSAGTTWDIPLAKVSITTGGAITLTDEREDISPAGLAGANAFDGLSATGSDRVQRYVPNSIMNGGVLSSLGGAAGNMLVAPTAYLGVAAPHSLYFFDGTNTPHSISDSPWNSALGEAYVKGNARLSTSASASVYLTISIADTTGTVTYAITAGSVPQHSFSNPVYVTSTTSPQAEWLYDGTHYLKLSVSSGGNATFQTADTAAQSITFAAYGVQVTGVYQFSVGGSPNDVQMLRVGVSGGFISSQTTQYGILVAFVASSSATVAAAAAYLGARNANSVNMTTLYGLYVENTTKGSSSTITNHYPVYVETPTQGGTANKTINTNSGAGTPAFLSTAGTWTNASSYARYKDIKGAITDEEVSGWFDWLLTDKAAAYRYRYPHIYHTPGDMIDKFSYNKKGEVVASRIKATGTELKSGGHQDSEYDTVFPLLDDMPKTLREAMTVEEGGSIGTKDMDGVLWALLRHQAQRISALEKQVLGGVR